MWKCHEFLELLEYINQNDKKKQINLIGIDNQFLKLSKKYLKRDMQTLEDSLRKYSPSFCLSDEFYKTLDMEIKYSNYFKKFNPSDTVTFTKYINKIDSILAINNLDNNNYYTFWSRVNYNLRTDFIRRFHSDRLRDSIMAENLTYYANNNPEAKIIVIAASYHLMYNVQSIANKAYWNKLTIGTKLKEKFGNVYYFLAFTPFFGRSGTEKGLFSFKIKPAQLGSIEYLMSILSDNSDFGLFCLRDNRNRIFLDNQLINGSRILGTKVQSMDVKNVCDGLFFIKEMKGVKYL
jgi:erythromycin esterase-like protein